MDQNATPIKVVAPHAGDPSVLSVEQLQVPTPGPSQLLVRVAASGVNYIDTYQRSGTYPVQFPFLLGSEGSGIIQSIGAGVSGFEVGERVMWNAAPGSYASHVLVPQANAYTVPDEIDLVHAAAIPLQGLTAHYLARSSFRIERGDIALIHAGAGGVGLLLTQIAKLHGAKVITTVSSESKHELSRLAGADHVIRYDQLENLTMELPPLVRDLSNQLRGSRIGYDGRGDGVDVVYDGVGESTFAASLRSLRIRGTLVLFGGASGQVAPFNLQELNTHGSLTVTRPSLGHFLLTRSELESRYRDLLEWIKKGSLSFRIGQSYSLVEAARAHYALEGRGTTGKTILIP